ncbi:MAG: branched-chain amino acid ABC transporter permease [Propionibacteriaceae bacterium]|nr:branched-chain amino acid ABC transporter permease [Propionibacteriaceae bacterium]
MSSLSTMTSPPPASTPLAPAARPLRRWLPLGLGVALVVFTAMLPLLNISVPGVFPGPTYTAGTLQLLAYAMLISALALSYRIIFGVGGMLSFGHALFFAAGAYGLGIALDVLAPASLPSPLIFALALLIALIFAFVLATVTGALALRVGGISFAMVTLAFAQAGSVMIRRNPGRATGGDEGLALDITHVPGALVGVVNTRNLFWVALVILVLAYLVALWLEKSRAGHVAAAGRENELRVRVLGLRPYLVKLLVFTVAGVLAAIAGMGYLLLQSTASPRIATADFTLTLLVIVVLGGVGMRWGAIVGGMIYTLLDQRLTALAGSRAVDALPDVLRIPLSEPLFLLGTLFILVVMFFPGGIAGIGKRLGGNKKRRTPAVSEVASDDQE